LSPSSKRSSGIKCLETYSPGIAAYVQANESRARPWLAAFRMADYREAALRVFSRIISLFASSALSKQKMRQTLRQRLMQWTMLALTKPTLPP
jgi:hypothetical protein